LRHGPQGPGALVGPKPALHGRRTRRAVFEAEARAPCSPVVFMSRGTPRYAPGSPGRPLQACGRVRRAEDARVFAVLSFKRSAFTLPPIVITKVAETTFAAAPALRAFTIAYVDTAAAAGPGEMPGTWPLRPWTWKTTRHVRPGRAISTRPLSWHLGESDRLRAGKHRAGRTRHAACEALRLRGGEAVRFFL